MHTQRRGAGFTLLEISIVLVLIGVIVGSGLVVFTSSLQASQYNATVARMDAIDKAILTFAVASNRIPCPSDLTQISTSATYGYEAGASAGGVGTGECYTGMTPAANFKSTSGAEEGGVPTRALRLPDDYMYDGWGRRFRYAVNPAYTKSSSLPAAVYSLCGSSAAGAITVNDATGAARTTAAAYVLVSHGANGHGAYTSNGVTYNAASVNAVELANCHCTSAGVYSGTYTPTYVEMASSTDTTNALDNFDDIVTFREPWQMQAQNYPLVTTAAQCVYVPDGGNDRVQVFTTGGSWVGSIGGTSSACANCLCTGPAACPHHSGSGNGQFDYPFGIAIDKNSNLWITDWNNDRVDEFSSSGSYLSQFGTAGSSTGQFNNPSGIAFDPSGNLWVMNFNADAAYGAQKFTTTGSYLTGFAGTLWEPTFVAVDGTGNLWISEPNGEYLEEYNSSGSLLNQFSSLNSSAEGLAFDASGNLWISDNPNGANYRIQEINTTGTVLSTFGSSGSANSQFNFYAGTSWGAVAIDGSGNVWVVDTANNRVQKFNSSGSFLLGIGSGYQGVGGSVGATGNGNGQFHNPFGIAIGNR